MIDSFLLKSWNVNNTKQSITWCRGVIPKILNTSVKPVALINISHYIWSCWTVVGVNGDLLQMITLYVYKYHKETFLSWTHVLCNTFILGIENDNMKCIYSILSINVRVCPFNTATVTVFNIYSIIWSIFSHWPVCEIKSQIPSKLFDNFQDTKSSLQLLIVVVKLTFVTFIHSHSCMSHIMAV